MPLNPQQAAFKENYCNPESETFGNAYQAAIKAGFAPEYAKVITAPSAELQWVAEILKRVRMLGKAEKVLEKTLDLVEDEDSAKIKIAQDSAKFIAKGLGGNAYSEKIEADITTGGKPLYLPSEIIDKNKLNEQGGV